MIGADQRREPWCDVVLYMMSESEWRATADYAALAQDQEIRIECDPSQCDDHAETLEQIQLALEVRAAVAKFFERRLVIRRRATHRSRDVNVCESHSIITRAAVRL